MFHGQLQLPVRILAAMLMTILAPVAGAADQGMSGHDMADMGNMGDMHRPPPLSSLGGPFTLTDQDGHTVTEKDFRGRYTLFYFGYARCDVACPVALANLASAINQLGPLADKVTPVFVDFENSRLDPPQPRGAFNYTETPKNSDGAHDHGAGGHDMNMVSPMSQAEFKSFLHAVHPRMMGLVGTRKQIWDISAGYAVRWEHEHPVTAKQKELGTRINHTTHMYLLGPDGKMAEVFSANDSAEKMAQRMMQLIGKHEHINNNASL